MKNVMTEKTQTGRIIHGDARAMPELTDGSIELVVTSPPYWQIKDYGEANQIGYGQTLHEYLHDLSRVWAECARVLKPGRRLCVNIGDQFARTLIYGRYKVIPLHAEVIAQCESLGLDFLGSIIWQKKTTMHTSGGASIMGSFPHPPNGIVELDYEHILLFKKPGPPPKVSVAVKAASRLTTEEWKLYFAGHWTFGGARQSLGHEAVFPDELPRRLIRMFSFVGETVLDPFSGSGTTAQVALDLGRRAVGYEISAEFVALTRRRLCGDSPRLLVGPDIHFCEREGDVLPPAAPPSGYRPQVQDAAPLRDDKQFRFGPDASYRVIEIVGPHELKLDTGLTVTLLGLDIPATRAQAARDYLREFLLGKPVLLRFDGEPPADGAAPVPAYVQRTNKLFVNRKMIEMGLARADRAAPHRLLAKFLAAEETARAD